MSYNKIWFLGFALKLFIQGQGAQYCQWRCAGGWGRSCGGRQEIVVLVLIPRPKHAWKWQLVPEAEVHQAKSQTERTSGAASRLKEHGKANSVYKHTRILFHQNQDALLPAAAVGEESGECHAIPSPLSRSLTEIHVQEKAMTLWICHHLGCQQDSCEPCSYWVAMSGPSESRGWGCLPSSSFLLTLQKCSPGQFLLHGNDCQSLLWGFTLWGKRSKVVHRGAWRGQGQTCLNFLPVLSAGQC